MAKSSNLPELSPDASVRIAQEEKKAKATLRRSILNFFDSADQDSLADNHCYRKLFPFFPTYAEALLNASAKEYVTGISDSEKFSTFLRKNLLKDILDQISQTPSRTIEWSDDSDEEDRPTTVGEFYQELLIEHESRLIHDEVNAPTYFPPEGLWEQVIDNCLKASFHGSLPNDWEHRFVYILRDQTCWQAFRSDLRSRLESTILEWESKAWTTPKSQTGTSGESPKSSTRGPKPKPHTRIAAIVSQHTDWKDPKNLKKICRQLDKENIGPGVTQVPPDDLPKWSRPKTWDALFDCSPDLAIKRLENSLKEAEQARQPSKS